jgi:hypothetical protein
VVLFSACSTAESFVRAGHFLNEVYGQEFITVFFPFINYTAFHFLVVVVPKYCESPTFICDCVCVYIACVYTGIYI